MKPNRFALFATAWVLLASATFAADSKPPTPTGLEPLLIDFSPYYSERFALPPEQTNRSFPIIEGRPMIDGVPFLLNGRARLYGKEDGGRDRVGGVDSLDIIGLQVGRTFEELHLVHTTRWADLESRTIAFVRLNYADGSRQEMPIGYGVHVRDWQRLQTEEKESLTDTNSKIIWRGTGLAHFKSSQRIFKSMLVNPHPDKRVDTIDFVSAGQIASYQIMAATLVNHDGTRPVTPPVPSDRPDRPFDGSLNVRVEDPDGNPIPDVWVYPNIEVPGTGWATITTPFYTTTDGTGVVRYAKGYSPSIYFCTRKAGWRPLNEFLRLTTNGTPECGAVMVIRMAPINPITMVVKTPGTNPATGSVDATASTANTIGNPGDNPPANGASGTAATTSATTGAYCNHVILMIDFPAGSVVRVEFASQLSPPNWQPLTTVTNLPFSPYPFDCGEVCPGVPQRFYRAALLP